MAKLLYNKYKLVRKSMFLMFVFEVVLVTGVFDLKVIGDYADHHLAWIFSVTSSVGVLFNLVLSYISFSLLYKIYILETNNRKAENTKSMDLKSKSGRSLKQHKVTTASKSLPYTTYTAPI